MPTREYIAVDGGLSSRLGGPPSGDVVDDSTGIPMSTSGNPFNIGGYVGGRLLGFRLGFEQTAYQQTFLFGHDLCIGWVGLSVYGGVGRQYHSEEIVVGVRSGSSASRRFGSLADISSQGWDEYGTLGMSLCVGPKENQGFVAFRGMLGPAIDGNRKNGPSFDVGNPIATTSETIDFGWRSEIDDGKYWLAGIGFRGFEDPRFGDGDFRIFAGFHIPLLRSNL